MKRSLRSSLVTALFFSSAALTITGSYPVQAITFASPIIIDGADASGTVHNQPSSWPSGAGTWNAKGARYNPATQKIVFETYRPDIIGGSLVSGAILASVYLQSGTLTAVTQYYVAGPGTGSSAPSGTSVLYVANRDGTNPTCIGCADIRDGVNGVKIYKALPSASATPNSPVEQVGAFVYANQNKDLASWYPDGQWIIASVEMSTHAITHSIGNSEIGMFNNLWAISLDGKTWVQLTDFASTWGTHQDPTAPMPYECYDASNCPVVFCQYAHAPNFYAGYESYACTDAGVPPPASGLMRSSVGNQLDGGHGGVPVVWGERTGIDFRYAFAGSQQLATAELVKAAGLPALITYKRNLTPTPSSPDGVGLWSNPGSTTNIGTGYEPWSFSSDDKYIGFASDIFAPTSAPTSIPISRSSLYFTDAISWRWSDATPTLTDLTKYDSTIFAYQPNAANGDGHWEDPAVFGLGSDLSKTVAFASSANLVVPWDPSSAVNSANTFGLDAWVVASDRSTAAMRLTNFNTASNHFLAYPTTPDPADNGFFMTVVPSTGVNPPGSVYKISEVVSVPPPGLAPALALSTTTLTFTAITGGPNPASQTVTLSNTGTDVSTWSATSDSTWLTVSPSSGSLPATTGSQLLNIGVAPGTLPVGVTTGHLTFTDQSGLSIVETLTLNLNAPLGSFTNLSSVRAYPNPWRSNRDANIDITFDQLPSGSTIKIYDLSGHWVRTLVAAGTSASWDRRNDGGDGVASGLYLYLITSSQGEKTRGKLTIIK